MSLREKMHAFFQEEGLQPTGIGPTIDTFGENNNLHSRVWVNYQAAAAFQQDSNRNARFVEFDDDRRMALTNDCVQTPLTPLHAVLSPAFIETAVVLGGKVMTGLQALELYAKALKVVDPTANTVMVHRTTGVVKFYSQGGSVCLGVSLRPQSKAAIEAFANGGPLGRATEIPVDDRDATPKLVDAVKHIDDLLRKRDQYERDVNVRSGPPNRFARPDEELLSTVLRKAAGNIRGGQIVNAHVAFADVPARIHAAVFSLLQNMENAGKPLGRNVSGFYPTSFFLPTGQTGIWRRTSVNA